MSYMWLVSEHLKNVKIFCINGTSKSFKDLYLSLFFWAEIGLKQQNKNISPEDFALSADVSCLSWWFFQHIQLLPETKQK
jgi:hypothetical protein